MDTGKEHLFSAKFACPICNYSLAELEPRLFSFNNPMGACPRCDGLGSISFFDPKRVVAFPQLSLASGAIKGWDRRNQFYFQMLGSLAKHVGFDLERPFVRLPERVQQILLTGSGDEKIPFAYLNRPRQGDGARAHVRGHHPEPRAALPRDGLADGARGAREVSQLEAVPRMRRHTAAARGAVRQGRHGRWRPRDLRDLRHAAARRRQPFRVDGPRRPQGRDRRPDHQGDREPARVPQQRRSRLPGARPLGGDALGRRVAADPSRVADRLRTDRRHVRAGRAVDRTAPARQRPAARHAQAPARSRQQRDRRRARPRRDLVRRLHRRHGARRGRARRPGRRAGNARGDPPRHAFADGPVSRRAPPHPDAGAPASRRSRPHADDRWRARQQPEAHHAPPSGRASSSA